MLQLNRDWLTELLTQLPPLQETRTETNEDGEEVEVEVEVTDDEAEQRPEEDEEEDREFVKYAVRSGAYQLCKRNGLGEW